MKRLILLLVLVVLLAVMAAAPASDTGASLAESDIAREAMAIDKVDESDPSESAVITITMYAVDAEEACSQGSYVLTTKSML